MEGGQGRRRPRGNRWPTWSLMSTCRSSTSARRRGPPRAHSGGRGRHWGDHPVDRRQEGRPPVPDGSSARWLDRSSSCGSTTSSGHEHRRYGTGTILAADRSPRCPTDRVGRSTCRSWLTSRSTGGTKRVKRRGGRPAVAWPRSSCRPRERGRPSRRAGSRETEHLQRCRLCSSSSRMTPRSAGTGALACDPGERTVTVRTASSTPGHAAAGRRWSWAHSAWNIKAYLSPKIIPGLARWTPAVLRRRERCWPSVGVGSDAVDCNIFEADSVRRGPAGGADPRCPAVPPPAPTPRRPS